MKGTPVFCPPRPQHRKSYFGDCEVANSRCRNSQLILPAVRTVGLFVVLAAMSSPISARSETRSSDVHSAGDNVVFDLWSTVEGITDCLRTTHGGALSGRSSLQNHDDEHPRADPQRA